VAVVVVGEYADGRPVYVLGAGFSRAAFAEMPVTDQLGDAVRDRLGIEWPSGVSALTFEERLTLLSTPLPFLEGHENTARRAQTETITAALAEEMDDRNNAVAALDPPPWLLELIALWHAERAVVITFNYDLIVEMATTFARPVVGLDSGEPRALHGYQVVYPAPSPVNAVTFRDNYDPSTESFQVLKLHGSLNWYWAFGQGPTLVRDASVYGFGEMPNVTGRRTSGISMLDRFLIPPVLSKDSFYEVTLAHTLWRWAYEHVRSATRLTVIGYSLPTGDRIVSELLRNTPDNASVVLVDRLVGEASDPSTVHGRVSALGLTVTESFDGDAAIHRFIDNRVAARIASLTADEGPLGQPDGSSVVAAIQIPGRPNGPHWFVFRTTDSGIQACGFNWPSEEGSSETPAQIATRTFPQFTVDPREFFDDERLAQHLKDGHQFAFDLEGSSYVLVGAVRTTAHGIQIVTLELARAR
jgi:hypothetical protein